MLTRDNLLRFVKDQKATTPTDVAKQFETSTMIASATLSELAKDKLILITHLKLSSSPYYYDPKQKEYLQELGTKHYSGYDKEIFNKIKEQQVLNVKSLNIQEALAIERIKDFAITIEIEHENQKLKFYIWYLRNIEETKKQIEDAIKPKKQIEQKISQKKEIQKPLSEQINSQIQQAKPINQILNQQNMQIKEEEMKFSPKEIRENQTEQFIENYLRQNYLQVDSKNKNNKEIIYIANLYVNRIQITFECIYYQKKPTEFDIITFYSSSINPKIIFVENAPKKLFKLSENLKNLTIVNI